MIKISYPINKLSSLLINETSGNNKNFKLYPTKKNETLKLFQKNLVRIALLTPTEYALVAPTADIRTIQHSGLSIEGMSGLLPLFSNDFTKLNTFKNLTDIDFFSKVLKLVYKERYQSDLKESEQADITLDISEIHGMFDLAEDFQDTFKMQLPIYIWCVRFEDGELDLEEITGYLKGITNLEPEYKNIDGREGMIRKKWDTGFEKSIDDLLELLYYQGETDELYSSKIYG